MRRERTRRGTPVQGLEHGRFDLDEPLGIEKAPHGGDHVGARHEQLPSLLVGQQVQLALAEAGLDIGQPVMFLGRRPQRLGQQRERVDAQRQLAPPRAQGGPVDADQVAQIEPEQSLHRLGPQDVDPRLELDPARAVDQIEERHLPLAAARRQPPRHPMQSRRLLARGERRVGRAHARDRLDVVELVRKRLDPVCPQRLELAPAGGEQLRGARGFVAHAPRLLPRADVDLGDLELDAHPWEW